MNYQRLNYPNGYKKVVQPGKPCPTPSMPHMPMPMPQPKEPIPPMPLPTPLPTPEPANTEAPILDLFPIDEGYVKGTIFRGLYKPYKNMSPSKPLFANERDTLLFDVNKYHFGMKELQFYLDNFPNDTEALRIFNEYRRGYQKSKQAFESKFGALCIASERLERGPWNWVQTLAPWKRGV